MLNIIGTAVNKRTNSNNKILQGINFMSRNRAASSGKLAGLKEDTVELSGNVIKNANQIDIEKIKKLNISNLRKLDTNSLSGATFENRPPEDLQKLGEAGIDKIIDFRADANKFFERVCKKNDFDYYNFPLDDVYNLTNPKYFVRTKGEKTVVTPEFVNMLKDYFRLMNEGKAFVGCQYGIDRTNIGLTLNYLLNVKASQVPPEIKTWPGEMKRNVLNKNIKAVKKIYKSLNDKQKEELQLKKGYQEALMEKIAKLIDANKTMVD